MSEIIQSYTGTLDNLNMSGLVFSLNMSGAQSTLEDHKFALKSITFTKPSSSGYEDPVYLNLWEMKEGESTYTYIISSTNASNTTTSSDGVWNFTGVELDIDSKYYITVTASPSSVMSELILVRSRVYSVPSGSGVGSHNYINNYNPPVVNFNWMPVMSLTLDETIEGSINISKGYYDSGSAKIIMPASTVSLTDLKSGETVGCKNKLFAYSKNNVAGVKITGDRLADISTAHDVSVDLNQHIYLDHTKEYIAGGSEIEPEWSFSNGGTTPNFVTTGSLTFGADGEVSGFSSSNTLKLDRIFKATSTQSFEISFKIKTGSYTGSIQEIFAMSPPLLLRTSSGYWNLPYNTGSWNDSNKDSVSASTVYFVKILYYPTTTTVGGVTYTGKYLYFEVYDSSKTLLHRYNYSLTGNFLNFQNAEAYLGSQGGTGEFWGGSIFLDENAYIKLDGELFWEPYTTMASGITTQKALVYDNVSDKTFWYPSATSLALSNFTTPADRSNLYYLNLFNVAAQLHAGESAPGSGDYMKSSDYVYLNHAHDKILGVQEEPDEIDLLQSSVTYFGCYTTVGSPTISNDYIASGFSDSNYLNSPSLPTGSSYVLYTRLQYNGGNRFMITETSTGYGLGNSGSSWKMWVSGSDYIGGSLSSGTWYDIRIEQDSTSTRLYVNNSLVITAEGKQMFSNSSIQTTLGRSTRWEDFEDGKIDLTQTYLEIDGTEVWRAVYPTFTEDFTNLSGVTVTSNYIASDFGNYQKIVSPECDQYAAGTINSFDLILQVRTGSTLDDTGRIWQPYSVAWASADSTDAPFVECSSSTQSFKLCFYDGNSYYTCKAISNITTNTWYLIRWSYSSLTGVISGMYSLDGGDTWITEETLTYTPYFNEKQVVLGSRNMSVTTFTGYIDLKQVSLVINGKTWWRPVIASSANSVEVSQDNYWTYLQGDSYDAQGATLAVSGMSPSALTGHLLVDTSGTLSYSEDTDISQSVLLPTKAYTGYDVTFTDNTYTTIQSVDKAGTKCRIYSSNIDAETRSQLFVALPVTEYEEGFEGGSLPYKSIVQSLLELKTPLEYTTTDSFVVTTTPGGFVDYYNPTEDKFYVYETGIYTGFRALSYSGDAYILDSTGA